MPGIDGISSVSPDFACSTKSLSREEVDAIHENVLQEGIVADELGSSAAQTPPEDRKEVENATLVDPGEAGGQVTAFQMPTRMMAPGEIAYLLNRSSTGAFSFGMLLNDSVRAGRCKDLNMDCPLVAGSLFLRNSGDGIKGDFMNVVDQVKEWTSDEKPNNLTEEQKAAMIVESEVYNDNNFTAQTFVRTPGKMIPNSLFTDSFTATMATSCDHYLCSITTYSMFDKYFNSWYSMDLTFANFGPTIVGGIWKAFGWSARRGFLDKFGLKWADKLRTTFSKPTDFLGKNRLARWKVEKDRYGLGSVWTPMIEPTTGASTAGYYALKGEPFRKWMNEIWQPDGLLGKIKDPKIKGHFYDSFAKWRGYVRTQTGLMDIERDRFYSRLKKLESQFPNGELRAWRSKEVGDVQFEALTPQARAAADAAQLEYSREFSKLMQRFDDDTSFDIPEWFARSKESGLWNAAVKQEGGEAVMPLMENSRHIQRIFGEFAEHGDFSTVSMKSFYKTADNAGNIVRGGKNLQLYRPSSHAVLAHEVGAEELKHAVAGGKYVENFAKLDTGEMMSITPGTLEIIERNTSGPIKIYTGGWEAAEVLTPNELARRINDYEFQTRLHTGLKENAERMMNTLKEREWKSRRYASLLDQAMMQEEQLIKSYFSVRGGAKWTAYPYAYYFMKKGLFQENLSGYMLPEQFYKVTYYTGEEAIYDDAFVDFFSNEGSDDGDMFIRIIKKFPWKIVLDEVSEHYNPIREYYDRFTKHLIRTKVGNLIYYAAGPEDCPECGISLKPTGLESFNASFKSNKELTSFILEDTPEDKEDEGQLLIAFGYHTNLKGEAPGGEGSPENIDLVKARKEGTTCGQKLEELFRGWDKASEFGAAVGGALAFSETLGYFLFHGSGIFGSAVTQIVLAPKFQDCVDDREGYYSHYFMPAEKEMEEKKDSEKNLEKNALSFFEGVKETWENAFASTAGPTNDAVKKVGEQIDQFVEKPSKNRVVEAILKTRGQTSGTLSAIGLFYYWAQGNSEMNPLKYLTEGDLLLLDHDSNTSVKLDFEKGEIDVNGEKIVDSGDNVRMSSIDTRIPGVVVPQTLGSVRLPKDSNDLMFEMNAEGELIVLLDEVKDCLVEGIRGQKGGKWGTENLSDVFGLVKSVSTDVYPNIFPRDGKIFAEGIGPRKIASMEAGGKIPLLQILADRRSNLLGSVDGEPFVGRMESIQMENGYMVFKPETSELLFWLRRPKDGILNKDDITGLKPALSRELGPDGCEELGLDFAVQADPNSPYKTAAAEKFNAILTDYGPFDVIDTERFLFIFYEDEDCNQHFKVIDKETGEVYDSIIDSISQTPEGVQIKTQDGRTHDLSFNAENGVPGVNYNGIDSLIKAMMGKNGSFWYDPETGNWYTENGQILPLLEAFKQHGIQTQVGEDGKVHSTPAGNVMTLNIAAGSQQPPWALPSVPEKLSELLPFLAVLFSFLAAVFVLVNRKKRIRAL